MNEWEYTMQILIDWIDDNITEDISLIEISKQLGYSPYYCSYKFHQITGSTLKRYIAERKLYHAAQEIRNSNARMLDIAIKYKFSSQEAFTRSFVNAYNCTPYDYRKSSKPLQVYPKQTVAYLNIDIDNKGCYRVRKYEDAEILKFERSLYEQYGDKVFNLLNGQSMYEHLKRDGLMEYGEFAPFNEAMCEGNATGSIFSTEFIAYRCTAHNVTLEQYKEITLEPLENFLKNKSKCTVLWFGDDMFCQINLLTALAYLDESNYQGKTFFNLVREDTLKVEQFEIEIQDYKKLYEQVVIQQKLPAQVPLPVLYNGIKLYLQYKNHENEITMYIKNHLHLSEQELLGKLFKVFPQYGLGDVQYLKLMRECKNKDV